MAASLFKNLNVSITNSRCDNAPGMLIRKPVKPALFGKGSGGGGDSSSYSIKTTEHYTST